MWGGTGNSAAPFCPGAQLCLDDRKREVILRGGEAPSIWKVWLVPTTTGNSLKQTEKKNKIPNFDNNNVSTSFTWQGKPKGNPLSPHQQVFMEFQGISAAFMGSSHLKIHELPLFPPLFHWRELEFAQSSPDIWELQLPRSEDEMLIEGRWKFFCSSATPTVKFSLFLFYSFNSWKEKTKAKKKKKESKHPNEKKTKTTTQPPATSWHSNRALSLQVTEIQIC